MGDHEPSAPILPPLQHLAVIMDGNGRWASKKGLNRFKGHIKGTEVAEQIIEQCAINNIPYLTLFAFSTENWKRPQREVDFLFSLLEKHINEKGNKLVEKNIRVETIGDLTRLPKPLQKSIQVLKEKSSGNTGLTLIFGLNYGGRSEILSAAIQFAKDHALKDLENIDLSHFETYLETTKWPAPDLVIRTSGEKRISNFMIWQMAYSELYFSDKLWPDFSTSDLQEALQCYSKRQRRFGTLDAACAATQDAATDAKLDAKLDSTESDFTNLNGSPL